MASQYRVKLDDLDWIEVGDGIRYKCHQQDGFQFRLIEFSKHMVHADWCSTGHMGYVLKGRMEVGFLGKTEVFEAGDALFIPDGEAHKHRPRALTDRVTLFSVEKSR